MLFFGVFWIRYGAIWGRFRKRNLKHAKECSIQQRRGFACGRLPLEAAFRLFSKLGSLGGSIRERFSRTGRTRPALARPAFSRWLLENDRLRERWPCQWLNVLYFPFSETSPIFWCFRRFPRVTRRGSSSGGGQICQNAEIPPSFMSLPCIFCKRMHLQYIEAFLVSNTAGALPQTPASLVAPQGQAVKTQPPDPVAKCWVGSKASRVKCTASPPLTPLSTSVRVAKRSEADGAGNLSRLAKQPLAAWPLQVGGDPTLVW